LNKLEHELVGGGLVPVINLLPGLYQKFSAGLRAMIVRTDQVPTNGNKFALVERDFFDPGDTFDTYVTGRRLECEVSVVVNGWAGLAHGYVLLQFNVTSEVKL
jgi:hypothetical protein